MMSKRLLPCLICAAMLSACETPVPAPTPIVAKPAKPAESIETLLTQAETANKGGRMDEALTILKRASFAFPFEKSPWLRMAQMQFEHKNYSEAVVNAIAALERDPEDTFACSIMAVSGLRLSSMALAELKRKNNISGTVLSESRDLAKLLRTTLGEEVLVPMAARTPPRGASIKSTATPASRESARKAQKLALKLSKTQSKLR
jgi:hypothetical protein